jgi:hypothetical protein
VFRGIIFVDTPPNVSTPSDNGVTSRSKISFTSPANTPACTAAPTATTSSGLTVRFGSFSKTFWINSCIAGIRVDPPTKTTSLISREVNFASRKAFSTGMRHRFIKLEQISSNLARVSNVSICFGPVFVAVIKW